MWCYRKIISFGLALAICFTLLIIFTNNSMLCHVLFLTHFLELIRYPLYALVQCQKKDGGSCLKEDED